jgi:hypothetical protein
MRGAIPPLTIHLHVVVLKHRKRHHDVIIETVTTLPSCLWFSAVDIMYYKGKLKVKLSLCLTKYHAMKTYWGSGSRAQRSLDLGTRWRWVVSFTPRPLYSQGKRPQCPLDRRLGGPQSRSGHSVEEKNSQPLAGIRTTPFHFFVLAGYSLIWKSRTWAWDCIGRKTSVLNAMQRCS